MGAEQAKLVSMNYDIGKSGINKSYGPATTLAVREYQGQHGLKVVGFVGRLTWGSLFPAVVPVVSTPALDLCAYAQAQVDNGSIYVLGSQGQTGGQITEAWIKYREHNKASNYKRAIALWKKRLSAGYANLCAFDCSGLIVKWLNDNGLYKSDATANGLYYNLCGAIQRNELQPGDLVFKKKLTSSKVYHTGVYVGAGIVIHSKGRSDGVVKESITATGWNRYGRLKCLVA